MGVLLNLPWDIAKPLKNQFLLLISMQLRTIGIFILIQSPVRVLSVKPRKIDSSKHSFCKVSFIDIPKVLYKDSLIVWS